MCKWSMSIHIYIETLRFINESRVRESIVPDSNPLRNLKFVELNAK